MVWSSEATCTSGELTTRPCGTERRAEQGEVGEVGEHGVAQPAVVGQRRPTNRNHRRWVAESSPVVTSLASIADHSLTHQSAASGLTARMTSGSGVDSSGPGTSGISSWWSNPSSTFWNEAVM